jgi:hypothetical protein
MAVHNRLSINGTIFNCCITESSTKCKHPYTHLYITCRTSQFPFIHPSSLCKTGPRGVIKHLVTDMKMESISWLNLFGFSMANQSPTLASFPSKRRLSSVILLTRDYLPRPSSQQILPRSQQQLGSSHTHHCPPLLHATHISPTNHQQALSIGAHMHSSSLPV